jgi:HSP20 family protein
MPLTSFDPFVQEFDRLAQRVFGNGHTVTRPLSVVPMDAIRRKDEIVLRFDLPGVDSESIDLTVDQGVLTVTARRAEEYGDGESAITRERVMGTFTRRVHLGNNLDTEHVEAAYSDGVLAVRLPLLEKARPRKVEIQGGSKKKLTS